MSEEMKNKDNKKISRREMMMKAGKYAAVTSVTMMVLSPKKAAAGTQQTPEDANVTDNDNRTAPEDVNWWLP